MSDSSAALQQMVADVAAAYFSNVHVSAAEIPSIIEQIARALAAISAEGAALAPSETGTELASEVRRPSAAQIRKSISRDALISFEDGAAYRTLRRHLAARGLTPEQYREKWGLPWDYPMVAASYSEARSAMAKTIGLGRKPAVSRKRTKA